MVLLHLSIGQNHPQKTCANGLSSVNRHNRPAAIRMSQEVVTTPDAQHGKSSPL